MFGLLACCGGCHYIQNDRPLTNTRISGLEQELSEQLPVGSTEADARAWYAVRGMNPTYVARIPDVKNVGLEGQRPTANIFGFHVAQIVVYVHFDDAGRVDRWSVTRFGGSF